jgi:hypothetical protein
MYCFDASVDDNQVEVVASDLRARGSDPILSEFLC